MHRPVLVIPPAAPPVTLVEMKQALRILERDGAGQPLAHEDDSLIESEIKAAVAHYDGWTGILGICLAEQTWRQDFDVFTQCMRLPLGPVSDIVSVKWRGRDGQISTVSSDDYALEVTGGGQAVVWFRSSFSRPVDLYERAGVQVEFKAGWPLVEGKSTVPEDLKAAIKMRVAVAYDEAAKDGAENLQRIEAGLLSNHKRWRL